MCELPRWDRGIAGIGRGATAGTRPVVLDIGLPKMDGYEIARRFKTKPQFAHTIIIMLSGRDGVIDRLKGRLSGAKDYITKPFKTQEVISVIQSHLGVPTYR